MWQEVFRIPGLGWPIYGYGFMLVVGFLSLIHLAKVLAKRSGLDPELFVNAALLALVFGVAGARLSHILENWGDFTNPRLSVRDNFVNMINIRSGGLTYYGGFLLATPVLIVYALCKRVPLLLGMDIVAPCLMIGLAFGRIGCFLNGCCYGQACEWGVRFPYHSNAYVEQYMDPDTRAKLHVPRELQEQSPDGRTRLLTPDEIRNDPRLVALAADQRALPVHPAQLYSSATAFLLAAVLLAFFTLAPPAGRVFALMLMLEGGTRYLLELIRVEPAVVGRQTGTLAFLPPMSLSMMIGLGLLVSGVAMWFVCGRKVLHPAAPLPA